MRATDVEHSTITECSDSSSFSLSKQPGNVFEIALVLSFYWFSSSAWLMLSILIIALHLCFYWFLELAPWLCFASVYALYINMIFTFTRDVRQPLPQIRLSLCVSLDRSWTNHLSLWNKRHRKKWWVAIYYWWNSFKDVILERNVKPRKNEFSGLSSPFFCRQRVSHQQFLCSISWWPLSVGCW